MYITLSNIQNGECVPLNPVLDNREGTLEVALSEILYYPAWVNISTELRNNIFQYDGKNIQIPAGYYDVCSLNEQFFEPQGLRLGLNPATGLVSVYNIKNSINLTGLGRTLGFRKYPKDSGGGPITGAEFPRLSIHKQLFVEMDGLSTSENRHNQFPSTLLRAISVKAESCNSGRTETFSTPYFKRLANDTLSSIRISVLDEHHMPVKLAYLGCVLEVRKRL
jgi:hypothetical protein